MDSDTTDYCFIDHINFVKYKKFQISLVDKIAEKRTNFEIVRQQVIRLVVEVTNGRIINLTLYDILHMPGLYSNLILIPKICGLCQDYRKQTQFLFIFFLIFIFFSIFFFQFSIFRTQGLGLEVIGHTVTSDGMVTTLITGLKRREQKVLEQNDVIQHGHHMLASCLTHGHLGQGAQYLAWTICRSI